MKRLFRIELIILLVILLAGAAAFYFHGRTRSGTAARDSLKKHIDADIIARAGSADGSVLASAAQDGTIQLYNEKGEPRGGVLPPPENMEPADAKGSPTLTALALSPDGSEILSAYSDGRIILRKPNGTMLRSFTSPDGEPAGALLMGRDFMVAGYETGEARILKNTAHDSKSPRLIPGAGHTGAVRRLLTDPANSKLVSAGDDDLILVRDISTGKRIASVRVRGAPISSLAFDETGEFLFVATEGDGLRVFGQGPSGPFSLRARAGRGVGFLSIAHAGEYIAAGRRDGPILLFKFNAGTGTKTVANLRPTKTLRGHLQGAVLLSFQPDGLVSAARDDSIRLWRLDGTPVNPPYLGHPDRVRHLAFAAKGEFIGAALGGNGVTNAVWLWNPAGKLMARHRGHEQDVDCLAISPDGGYLASGSSDNTIRLTRLKADGTPAAPTRVLRDHERRITRLDFSPDGRLLLSAAGDGTIRLRNPSTGALLSVLRGHRGTVTRARFSADGRFILSGGGDRTLRLWPLTFAKNKGTPATGEARVYKVHTLGITAAAISPDGRVIASAAWDRTMRILDAKEGLKKTIQLPPREWIIALAFHPERKLIAGGGWDGGLRFWDYTGREIARIKDVHGGRVSALAFRADGEVLATSSYDRTIRLHRLDDLLP